MKVYVYVNICMYMLFGGDGRTGLDGTSIIRGYLLSIYGSSGQENLCDQTFGEEGRSTLQDVRYGFFFATGRLPAAWSVPFVRPSPSVRPVPFVSPRGGREGLRPPSPLKRKVIGECI